MAHRTPSEIGIGIPCWAASYSQARCMAHNTLCLAAISYSTLHLCLVSWSPEKWFLVLRWSSLQQGLHDHHANVGQISEPNPDDAKSEQSSHNTESMTVAESIPLQACRPAIESRKWALLWHACHFYEAFSVHLALWLSHCLAHILAHMMNLSLSWCWKQGVCLLCWKWEIGLSVFVFNAKCAK